MVNRRWAGNYINEQSASDALRGILANTSSTLDITDIPNAGSITHPLIRKTSESLIRRFYSVLYISTNGTNPTWQDWNSATERSYNGVPSPLLGYTGAWRGARAYPFEFNPVNPETSSPWHNIIYERFFEHYNVGFRSVHLHFPFGGYAHSWLGTPLQWLANKTSKVDPQDCQARVRGFQGAVKGLLNGNLTPAGRPVQITEPCDVILYTNGACGYKEYRDQLHALHASLSGSLEEKDALLNAFIDNVADFYIGCLGGDGSGVLTVIIDTSANSATPSCLAHHRSLPDYVSDACELVDWRFANRLESRGIRVLAEARPRKLKTVASYNSFAGVTTSGVSGSPLPVQWHGFGAGANWAHFSDPAQGDPFYADYFENGLSHHNHLQHGSYLATVDKLQRIGVNPVVFNGAATRNLNTTPPTTFGVVYTPHHAMVNIYTAADVVIDHLWRSGDTTQDWNSKRVMRGFMTYGIDSSFLGGWPQLFAAATPGEYTFWDLTVTNTMQNWVLADFITNPTTYTGGYWTTASKAFFNSTVRQNTLQDFIDVVLTPLAVSYRPPGKPGVQTEWGQDPVYLLSVDLELRTP
jgi:hypothetical protein